MDRIADPMITLSPTLCICSPSFLLLRLSDKAQWPTMDMPCVLYLSTDQSHTQTMAYTVGHSPRPLGFSLLYQPPNLLQLVLIKLLEERCVYPTALTFLR